MEDSQISISIFIPSLFGMKNSMPQLGLTRQIIDCRLLVVRSYYKLYNQLGDIIDYYVIKVIKDTVELQHPVYGNKTIAVRRQNDVTSLANRLKKVILPWTLVKSKPKTHRFTAKGFKCLIRVKYFSELCLSNPGVCQFEALDKHPIFHLGLSTQKSSALPVLDTRPTHVFLCLTSLFLIFLAFSLNHLSFSYCNYLHSHYQISPKSGWVTF